MPAVPGWLVVVLVLVAAGGLAWLFDLLVTRGWGEYWLDMLHVKAVVRRDRRRKGSKEEQKARLVQAILDYWGDDLRYADRVTRKRFADEFSSVIMETISPRGKG